MVECEDVGQPSHGLQKAVQMFFRESDRQHVSEDTATLREKQKGVHHERVTDFISRSISVVTVHVISSTYPYSNFYNFVDLFKHMLIICTGLLIFLNFESDCLLTYECPKSLKLDFQVLKNFHISEFCRGAVHER